MLPLPPTELEEWEACADEYENRTNSEKGLSKSRGYEEEEGK